MLKKFLLLIPVVLLVSCGGGEIDEDWTDKTCEDIFTQTFCDSIRGENGDDGSSCTVTGDAVEAIISCTNGSSATVHSGENGHDGETGATGAQGEQGETGADGKNGTSCSTLRVQTGAFINCDDGTEAFIKDGADGQDGSSCSTTQEEYGALITCTDGTESKIYGAEHGFDMTVYSIQESQVTSTSSEEYITVSEVSIPPGTYIIMWSFYHWADHGRLESNAVMTVGDQTCGIDINASSNNYAQVTGTAYKTFTENTKVAIKFKASVITGKYPAGSFAHLEHAHINVLKTKYGEE